MLKKRIIPCLDIKDGRVVKGVNFLNLRDAGDPVELAEKYALAGADELVFLDISATIEKRKTLAELVEKIARKINIPFTVGGGISSVADAEILLKAGADKISLNSSAVKRPELIAEIAEKLGSQAVVVAIDTKRIGGTWKVFVKGGNEATSWITTDWAKKTQSVGAGEILLTSMENDGVQSGFALDIIQMVCESVTLPVIASGGAGKLEDFSDVFLKTDATGALAAGVFHFGTIHLPELKDYLRTQKIPMR